MRAHRSLYVVFALLPIVAGVACGSSPTGDGQVDAGSGADAVLMVVDARADATAFDGAVADARPDGGASTADARPAADAVPPPPDAAQVDAAPNCPGGNDPGCAGIGLSCMDPNTQQQCEMVAPGCFKLVAGTAQACSSNKSCTAGLGCVCDAQPKCDGPGGGTGRYCGTPGDDLASPQSAYSCANRAEDDDECVVPVEAEDCVAPSICAEATAGAATCVCPAPATLPDAGCGNQVGVETCASDGGTVLRCEVKNAGGLNCNVWTTRDNCAADGLTCESSACVCPDTGNQKEFFANPVVDRSKRPGLLPTGVRFPPQCSMPLLSQAAALAVAEGFDGFFSTFAVAADDGAPEGTTEIVFAEEPLPLVIPDHVTVTTLDHPRFASPGSPIRDTYWKIKANSFNGAAAEEGAQGFVWLRGRDDANFPDHPGGSLIGFEIDVEPCRFEAAPTLCEYPIAVVHATGYSANQGGALGKPNLRRNFIDGRRSGVAALAQPATTGDVVWAAFDGVLAGGEIEVHEDGTFTYEAAAAPDPADPRWTDGFFAPISQPGCAGASSYALLVAGAANAGNNGLFPVVGEGDADSIVLGGPAAVDEALPAGATATLYCLVEGSFTRYGLFVDGANGVFEETTFTGFLSQDPRSRSGVYVGSVFDDRGVVFSGGAWSGNDVGLFVDESVDADTVVTVGPSSLLGPTFSGNLDAGILILKPGCGEDGVVFSGTGLVVERTFRQTFENPFGLGAGHGVVIDGLPMVTIEGSTLSGNAQDGVHIETDLAGAQAKPGLCTASPGAIIIESSTLSENGFDGLQVHDFFGRVEIRGGAITGNGTDLGVRDFDAGAALDERVYAVGNGIRVDGCVSGADFEGECRGGFFVEPDPAGARPQITGNTLSGLRAVGSSLYVTSVDLSGNGTANKCIAGRPTSDARDAAVVIGLSLLDGGSALGHFTDVKVNGNHGTGLRIGTGAQRGRANTIAASQVNGNLNLAGCAFDPREPAFAPPLFSEAQGEDEEHGANITVSAGIHVRDAGHLQVVNGTTEVDGNTRHGIYNSGRIDLFTSRPTELDSNDPAAEVDGMWSIDGNGWNGFHVSSFSDLVELAGGNISGNGAAPAIAAPNEGFEVVGARGQINDVTVTGTAIEDNAGDGVLIDTADLAGGQSDKVRFTDVTITGNGGSGVRVLGAPGSSPVSLTTVPLSVSTEMYGFKLEGAMVSGNQAEGIVLGRATGQTTQVLAMIGGPGTSNGISANGGAGIVVRGGALVGATIAANLIHDNGGAGLELASSIIVPLFVDNVIELGLGFVSNEVNHNAMAASGCDAAQTRAQIYITGPTAIPPGPCPGAASKSACVDLNDPVNQHCLWTGSNCVRAHDLKGDIEPACPNALRNSIFDYNTSDSGNNESVGARAIGSSQADLDNNEWKDTTSSQNVSGGSGSFIEATSTCGTRGCSR